MPPTSVIIALDIGTSSTKGSVFHVSTRDGRLHPIRSSTKTRRGEFYETSSQPPFSQNSHGWVDAALHVLRELVVTGDDAQENIVAVSITGAMQQLVMVDMEHEPAIMYSDAVTAMEEANDMIVDGRAKMLEELTGNWKGGASMPAKLTWMAKHKMKSSNIRPHRVLFSSHGFVAYELTGRTESALCCDSTTASTTGLLLSASDELKWIDLERIGLDGRFILPKLLQGKADAVIGTISFTSRTRGRIPSCLLGVPVIHAAGDVGTTLLGASFIRPGVPHLYLGTSGWIAMEMDRHIVHKNKHIRGFMLRHPLHRDKYIFGMPTTSAGLNITAWADALGCKTLKEFDQLAAGANVSEHDVLYLPHLSGERFPLDLPQAKGILFNLTPAGVSQPAIARAVMEGIAFQYRWCMEDAKRNAVDSFQEMVFCGGGSESEVLAKQLAMTLDAKLLVVMPMMDVTVLGAALMAVFVHDDAHNNSLGGVTSITITHESKSNLSQVQNVRFKQWKQMIENLYGTRSRGRL